MNPKLRPYAWIGLAVSAAAILFSIVYYFLLRKFDLPIQIGLGLFVIGLAAFALFDPQKIREVFTGRDMKYGSNMAVFLIAILGILVVLNFLANKYDQKWDFTEDKTNTLSDESIAILESLPSKVDVLAFFTMNYSTENAEKLLDNFKQKSQGKFDYRFIDPDNDPVAAQNYGVTADGTLVLLMNDRQQTIRLVAEEEIDAALIKLSNPNTTSVYFLTGHGEHDPIITGDDSYSAMTAVLQRKNYAVNSLNLLTSPTIPEDADTIVVAGPRKPLTNAEVQLLKGFAESGKSLVIMENSTATNDFSDSEDPLAEYLRSDWGISLDDTFILDMSSNSMAQAIANKYGNHAIVNRLAGMITIFPSARSVTATEIAPENVTLTTLVFTSENSWAETDMTALKENQYQYNEGVDIPGPVPMAIAGSNSATQGRVVVVGSSFFAVDKNYSAYGNGDFFVNAIDWATENESLINLTPKTTTSRMLVTPSNLAMGVIFLVSVVALPLLIIVMGVSVWIQRRKRG